MRVQTIISYRIFRFYYLFLLFSGHFLVFLLGALLVFHFGDRRDKSHGGVEVVVGHSGLCLSSLQLPASYLAASFSHVIIVFVIVILLLFASERNIYISIWPMFWPHRRTD